MEHELEGLDEVPAMAWLPKEMTRRVIEGRDEEEEGSYYEMIAERGDEVSLAEAGARDEGRERGARRAGTGGRDGDAESAEAGLKDSVGLYLDEVRRFGLLTAEEEIRLTRAAQAGDREARDRIITRNLRLVISIAKRYQGLGLPLADLIEEGNLGLMRSVDRFDWRRGLRFSTYSSKWIRQSITRALVNTSRTVRLPSNVLVLLKQIGQVQRRFNQEEGRRPTHEELCRRLGISMLRLAEVYGLTNVPVSLDVPLTPDASRHRLHDLLPARAGRSPAQAALESLERRHVARLLAQLSPREQRILGLRFGFGDHEPMSLEETGAVLGVTRERVRQLEVRALSKLRKLSMLEEGQGARAETSRSPARVRTGPRRPARRPTLVRERAAAPRKDTCPRRSRRPARATSGLPRRSEGPALRVPAARAESRAQRRSRNDRKRPIMRKTPIPEGWTSCGSSASYPSTSGSQSSSGVSAA